MPIVGFYLYLPMKLGATVGRLAVGNSLVETERWIS